MSNAFIPYGAYWSTPFAKWQGPLRTQVSLALIDYPPGDTSLHPIRDQVYTWLFEPEHLQFPRSLLIPGQEDRFRRCAGQEAYTVWATLRDGAWTWRVSAMLLDAERRGSVQPGVNGTRPVNVPSARPMSQKGMSAGHTILPPAFRYLRSVQFSSTVSTTVSGALSRQNTTTLCSPSAIRASIQALSCWALRI